MESIKNLSNSGKAYGKKFIIPIMIALSSVFANEAAAKTAKVTDTYWKEISAVIKNPETDATDLRAYFQENDVPEKYLESNLFVNGKTIKSTEFNHTIKQLWNDKYQVKYSHPLEGIPNFSQPSIQEITINVEFTYKDNNIYIKFEEVSIKWNKLWDNWAFSLDETVYDYDISEWENKSIEINCKANVYKTKNVIENKIKNTKFSFLPKIEENKEFENTQLTKLNEISLWKEVTKEWEAYYREVFMIENWKYRAITKIYFDKYGIIDNTKTNTELKKKNNLVILGINLELNLEDNNWLLESSISDQSIISLQDKVIEHRKNIINLIDKAKIGPNTDFTWFNKNKSKRDWSDKEEWLFDTKLVSLELINDTYIFQRGDETQKIYFGTEHKEGWEDKIYLKNENEQKVEEYFVKIWNNYYNISLKNNEISIDKIKKEGENIKNNLPIFSWDENIVTIINSEDKNISYNPTKKQLDYYTQEWRLITSISCEKSDKGDYKLNNPSINIDIEDLFNFPAFSSTVNEIKLIQKELNTLDIDILNSFQSLLNQKWIKLSAQNLVKVIGEEGDTYYCNVKSTKNWFNINKNDKLYKEVEKYLKDIKSRLEIVKKLNDAEIRWTNNWKKEDFTKFVWWLEWVGTRFISQNNIKSFISQSTNEINLEIMWWEAQTTIITYDISTKKLEDFQARLKWKSKISISGQSYKLKIDKKWKIFLDPVEK